MIFTSYNPATGEKIYEGKVFLQREIDHAVDSCQKAFINWSCISLKERISFLKNFQEVLKKDETLSQAISEEMGKPLWDSKTEVLAMINKIDISIDAYSDRCKELKHKLPQGESITRHKPHGVVAIFGPYNFPGHLPNGHIVPALLAGNTCLFKPSELTPYTAIITLQLWKKAGLPDGVIELALGGKETGQIIVSHPGIKGLFFTGSFKVGQTLLKQCADQPEKILALEMGGNNPLIVHNVKDFEAASFLTIQSAFLTSGQRCTCARRLIVPKGQNGDTFIETLREAVKKIKVGAFTDNPEPFMGPLVSIGAAEKLLASQNELLKNGATSLIEMKQLKPNSAFLTPGIIDVTDIKQPQDEEFFGPLLQMIRSDNFESAISHANNTVYGLAAGLLSDDRKDYEFFYKKAKAGVINWNVSLTGASSRAPFGGIGHSGNFRPSAYYAADYSSYPVASIESEKIHMPEKMPPGLQ